MADFRFKNGIALGWYGSPLSSTSANMLLTPQDTTPDVTLGNYFLTNNTSTVAITWFDGTLAGGFPGPEEGKVITIRFQDSNTTIVNGGRMFLAQSGGAFRSGEILSLIHSGSAWYELYRAENAQGVITVSNVGAAVVAPNVDGVKTLILTATAAAVTLISFSGGEIGQKVDVVQNSSNVITVTTGGNIRLAGTSDVVLNASGAYQFVKRADNVWSLFRPAA